MKERIDPRERQLDLPFDQHQRYKLVTEALGRLRENGAPLEVLDVGGAEGTILNFLDGDEVTILDQAMVEGVPGLVQGDATALPFEDGSFDYVTSVDTYEHIELTARERYLSELRRVARKGVLLAAPFEGDGVREAEELANRFFQAFYGQKLVWLEEHEEHGLPELDETRKFYEEQGDSVTVLPNGYLPNWLAMICTFFYSVRLEGEASEVGRRANRFYNQFLYEHDNVEPCYRYVVVALRAPSPVNLQDLTSPPVDPGRASLSLTLHGPLTTALSLGAELRRARVQLMQNEVRFQEMARKIANQAALQQENRKLKNQLQAINNSRSWRVARLLGELLRLGR